MPSRFLESGSSQRAARPILVEDPRSFGARPARQYRGGCAARARRVRQMMPLTLNPDNTAETYPGESIAFALTENFVFLVCSVKRSCLITMRRKEVN
jgi:hypothetical protein